MAGLHSTDESEVDRLYSQIFHRRVDLVSDYAGDELFMIEGDSLLLECFSDRLLDFKDGFQMLRAAYAVERLLLNFLSRKCRFHLVFFDSHRNLCIPAKSDERDASKYRLMRAVIFKHLQSHLEGHTFVEIRNFHSLDDPLFQDYLFDSRVYFTMCYHDDASSQVSFRNMILWFAYRQYTVALINGIEWRDTKAIISILENNQAHQLLRAKSEISMLRNPPCADILQNGDAPSICHTHEKLTEREQLTIDVLSQMKKQDSGDNIWIKAFLEHTHMLRYCRIRVRRMESIRPPAGAASFLAEFIRIAHQRLLSRSYYERLSKGAVSCDLVDLVDGRVFNAVASFKGENPVTRMAGMSEDDNFAAAVREILGIDLTSDMQRSIGVPVESSVCKGMVMPFRNSVFLEHLRPIELSLDQRLPPSVSDPSSRVFQELTHWHNHTKPLDGKAKGAITKIGFFAHKRNQRFMTEIAAYAGSLTNIAGRSLDPETVVATENSNDQASRLRKPPKPTKTRKQSLIVAEAEQRRRKECLHRSFQAWRRVRQSWNNISTPESRYAKATQYLKALPKEKRTAVEAEVVLSMANDLLLIMVNTEVADPNICALVFDLISTISGAEEITEAIRKHTKETCKMIGYPDPQIAISSSQAERPPAFEFLGDHQRRDFRPPGSFREFQLEHCGPYLDRSVDASEDSRVPFNPDRWQREVLDEIDKGNSIFVVAPTSAGKTFISFYAMKHVLQADDQGVLVYVAPTKALVNQIAAEIHARFSKSYPKKSSGKSVWAIHTRDYRINNPAGCQILVTVPHILQIMLLSASNANSWSTRVKWIIFDEVHCIGQADDGVVWEQLLLLAPCPIIALSATVGNPDEFNEWLASTQKSQGRELTMILHPHRYSELRKFVYTSPAEYKFKRLTMDQKLGQLGLDSATEFAFVHPIASLMDSTRRSRGIPEDLNLEARDCLTLWKAMSKHQNNQYPVDRKLDPSMLPEIIRKSDVIEWGSHLKALLRQWMSSQSSPFELVLEELRPIQREDNDSTCFPPQSSKDNHKESTNVDLITSTLPMLSALYREDALPALLFNYDRTMCEKIAHWLLNALTEAEEEYKRTSPKWISQLDQWRKWKAWEDQKVKSKAKVSKSKRSSDREPSFDFDPEYETANIEPHPLESFNPDDLIDGFHFSNRKRLQLLELVEYEKELIGRGVSTWLCQALRRGIGVHHAGMNRKYRHVVEILFRRGFLQVVIATGTLALGINMPTKTVVFSGDSIYLTALNFRQASGRAGRRGFDLLGNVVFQGIPTAKVYRLISSRLPDLNGHFPITTSLVLRLCGLLHNSGHCEYAIRAVNALLSQPRLSLGDSENKLAVLHHLRFSIEYLRQQNLLDADGAPINFAGAVSHLYYTENASFAFHQLLKEGYFHQLCVRMDFAPSQVLLEIMLVMSHIFGRYPAHQKDLELVKHSSSVVFLPELPRAAADILREHNRKVLEIFTTYVRTYNAEHLQAIEDRLPLSDLAIGISHEMGPGKVELPQSLPPVSIRSAFVALSGHGDNFTSIAELCATVRSGVFLEENVVPHVPVYPDDTSTPLNAYLLDFFKHGSTEELVRANKLRPNDVWFVLNDFSLVLATIVTSLQAYIGKGRVTDVDEMEIVGGGDEWELFDGTTDKEMELSGASSDGVVKQDVFDATAGNAAFKKLSSLKKKAADLDSWEDDEEEAEEAQEEPLDLCSVGRALEFREHGDTRGLLNVLRAFTLLKKEFDEKFKIMWA